MTQYKLQYLTISGFKNFLKYQSKDENFIYDILSKCIISGKNTFLKLYDQELGIRNIHNFDKAVDTAFNDVLFKILDE